jgi:hypothetical protein
MADRAPPSVPQGEDHPVAEILRRHERAMMKKIGEALEETGRSAAAELKSAGFAGGLPRADYFDSVALHLLFLQQCGADQETSEGGDARRAARILHIGRRISAHHWEGVNATANPASNDGGADKHDVDDGAQRLAYRTVIQALVEQAGSSDPDLRARIEASVDAYIERLDPQSDLEHDFAERAKRHIATLLRPPQS